MNEKCCLPQFNSCCCTCQYRLTDHYHCTTASEMRKEKGGCVCGTFKGYVCAAPEMPVVYSGWSEHGMCEMWTQRDVTSPRR